MLLEQFGVVLAMLLEQPRRALHVREQERHGAARERAHGQSMSMNRLAHETSPYLRQHADNPVDWYPWGDEALARAAAEDKPILLSVGYSSCHWCHVMAHESFEKPDIDAVYMDAVQALTGQGGWPMTVFLAPDGRPFYGGTYFPPADRGGMPGFGRIMGAVADGWADRRDEGGDENARL